MIYFLKIVVFEQPHATFASFSFGEDSFAGRAFSSCFLINPPVRLDKQRFKRRINHCKAGTDGRSRRQALPCQIALNPSGAARLTTPSASPGHRLATLAPRQGPCQPGRPHLWHGWRPAAPRGPLLTFRRPQR